MFCYKCGTEVVSGSKFCKKCGCALIQKSTLSSKILPVCMCVLLILSPFFYMLGQILNSIVYGDFYLSVLGIIKIGCFVCTFFSVLIIKKRLASKIILSVSIVVYLLLSFYDSYVCLEDKNIFIFIVNIITILSCIAIIPGLFNVIKRFYLKIIFTVTPICLNVTTLVININYLIGFSLLSIWSVSGVILSDILYFVAILLYFIYDKQYKKIWLSRVYEKAMLKSRG